MIQCRWYDANDFKNFREVRYDMSWMEAITFEEGGTGFEGPKKFRIPADWTNIALCIRYLLISTVFWRKTEIVPFLRFSFMTKTSDGFWKLNQQLNHVHFEQNSFLELKKSFFVQVTVIDANNPAEVLDSFQVCSSHLLCIASVPGDCKSSSNQCFGSGIQCLFDPGSRIRNCFFFRIPQTRTFVT